MPRRSKRLQGIAVPPVQPDGLARRRRSRLQAAPKPLTTIDYNGFPHIIEAIVHYACDEGVLLAFRQTCRSLQRFVDDWFPRSITFDADGIARLRGRDDVSLDFVRLVDTHISRDVNDFGDKDVEEAFELKQVCSCEGDVFHLCVDFNAYKFALRYVEIVRRDHTSCPTSIPSSTDCVTFFDLSSMAPDKAVVIPFELATAPFANHVLHFLYRPNEAFPLSFWQEDGFWELPDHNMVIILSAVEMDEVNGVQPSCTGNDRCPLYQRLLSFIRGVLWYASLVFLQEDGCAPYVTFVGVEDWDKTCMHSGIVQQHHQCRNETLIDVIQDMMLDILIQDDMDGRFESVEDARDHFDFDCNSRFWTFEEYRDQVGDEQFALEMGKGWQGRNAWTESQV